MHQYFKNHLQWQEVLKISKILIQNKHQAFVVGGCVRDFLLQRPPKDFDMASNASTEDLLKLFPEALDLGLKFSVLILVYKDFQIQLNSFRKDGEYHDGRRPVRVEAGTIKEDSARRDFSINALFYDLQNCNILDFYQGQNDLKQAIIKSVGPAHLRFKEDHLRMLRAIRFSVELDFTIEEQTKQAIIAQAFLLKNISKERLGSEFKKIFTAHFVSGLNLLQEHLLLKSLLPHLDFNSIKTDLKNLDSKTYLSKACYLQSCVLFFALLVQNKQNTKTILNDLKILKFTKTDLASLNTFLEVLYLLECFCLNQFFKNLDTKIDFLNSDLTTKDLASYYSFADLIKHSQNAELVITGFKSIVNNPLVFSSVLIKNLKLYLNIFDAIKQSGLPPLKWKDIDNKDIALHNRSKLLALLQAKKTAIFCQNLWQKSCCQ